MLPQKKELKRRRSIRLQTYDYATAGAYFLTICTKEHHNLFGQIIEGTMHLNDTGHIVHQCWQDIPLHFPHLQLDEHTIMPNHIHGIIFIADHGGTACRVPTKEQFGRPVSGSIPTIVRSFKSAVTKNVNKLCQSHRDTLWQRNYWEHVIRDDEKLNSIRGYIHNNPAQWGLDELYAVTQPG